MEASPVYFHQNDRLDDAEICGGQTITSSSS